LNQPRGKVVAIRTEASGDRVAFVDVDAMSACARCAAGKGCGAGMFTERGSRRLEARVPGALDIAEGDTVRIDMAGGDLLPAALIVYGWPLAGAAAGSLLAMLGPWQGDAVTAAGAVAGLVLAGVLARRRLASGACIDRFRPVVVERSGVTPVG
jgi:positive regulator of sigma E activity